MDQKNLTRLTDVELIAETKKIIPTPVVDAFLIGFLIGIIIYGVAANAKGFFMIIPLFMIYLFLKKSKRYGALKKEMNERGLES